jgi:3-methyladenine DNA glycosylase AlkD
MTAAQTLQELRSLGSDSYKKILLNHGIPEPVLGVKVADLKRIQKRIKKDHQLSLDLYDTGIYDAMYLAGLIADPAKMTRKDLSQWMSKTKSDAICGSALAWVAAESAHGWELGLQWLESKKELTATGGWETLANVVALRADEQLDLPKLKELLQRVAKTIHDQPNRVRYCMNAFVIAVGSYVAPLTDLAINLAEKVGEVSVDMGNTACQVPFAPDYIRKVQKRGTIGKKRKSVRC